MTIKAENFHQPSLHRKHLMANLERTNIHFSGVWRMTKGHFSRISFTPLAFISSSLAAAKGSHTGSMITPPLASESTMDLWKKICSKPQSSCTEPRTAAYVMHMSQLNFRNAKTVTTERKCKFILQKYFLHFGRWKSYICWIPKITWKKISYLRIQTQTVLTFSFEGEGINL